MENIVAFVDDESEMHELANMFLEDDLEDGDYKLMSFFNGEEVMEYLETSALPKFVLLLSDINMPKMDGFTLLENIKKKFPSIDVVMQSAYGSDDYIDKAKKLGAKDFIEKPIDFDELKILIKEQIQKNAS